MWMRHRKPAVAFLYDLGAAVPKREYSAGLARSVAAMLAARSTCRACGTVYDFCLPTTRDCVSCQNQPAPEGSDQ
jgi:hypothetical protein